jgi:hypothetical protein
MTIDHAGNIGIGTSAPSRKLELNNGGTGALVTFTDGVATNFTFKTDGSSVGTFGTEAGSTQLAFMVAGTEAARFDGSRNLLVGGTEINPQNQSSGSGSALRADGRGFFRATSATVLGANLIGNDGEVIRISKNGATAGKIGTVSGDVFIANAVDVGLYLDSTGTDHVAPCNIDGSKRDNAIDLGASGTRFKDGYFSGYLYAAGLAGISDGNTYFQFSGSDNIKVFNGGSEKFRFGSDGAFMVGQTVTSAPGAGNTATGITLRGAIGDGFFSRSNGTAGYFNVNQDDNVVAFLRSGTQVGGVNVTSSGTTFATSSDKRLKSNIQDSASASDKIDAIQVRQFDWNVDDSHQDYGLIAQELQPIEPMAVSGNADSDEMMGVDYSKLVPMLIKAVQELKTELNEAKTRIATLEAK